MSRWRAVGVVGIALAVASIAVFIWAIWQPPGRAGATFTALQTVATFAAVLLAVVAVLYARPAYLEVLRDRRTKAVIKVEFQLVENTAFDLRDLVPDEVLNIAGDIFLNVFANNVGDRAARDAVLTVMVPFSCELQPVGYGSLLSVSPVPGMSDLLTGERSKVKFATMPYTFMIGQGLVVPVRVRPIGPGPHVVAALVAGSAQTESTPVRITIC